MHQQRADPYLFGLCLKYFQKYQVIFHLDKCKFIQSRIEYVGNNIMKVVNTLEQSKFNIIKDWKLTKSGQFLHYLSEYLISI